MSFENSTALMRRSGFQWAAHAKTNSIWIRFRMLSIITNSNLMSSKVYTSGKLEQSGHTEPEVIDFIKEALRYKDEDVTYISGARRLDPESCKQAIRRGISKHASYLAKYTGV